jgi:hypothetical protein
MAGLVPAIHVFAAREKKDVDARDKPGHDRAGRRGFSFSRHEMSELLETNRPRNTEGAGKAGHRLMPMVRVQQKKHAAEPQVQPRIPGLPCAMVFTVSFVLFPVTGLFCHRHP